MVGAFQKPSCGRSIKPIHSIPNSVAHRWGAVYKYYSYIIQGITRLREEYGSKFSEVFKSITADNGTEFTDLSSIEQYGTKVYFAHPYSSWERPKNERHNRILRRYIPKGKPIDQYTADEIEAFGDAMNSLPRRHLQYKTPSELYEQFLDEVYSA